MVTSVFLELCIISLCIATILSIISAKIHRGENMIQELDKDNENKNQKTGINCVYEISKAW